VRQYPSRVRCAKGVSSRAHKVHAGCRRTPRALVLPCRVLLHCVG
jgi:hypothetical protein